MLKTLLRVRLTALGKGLIGAGQTKKARKKGAAVGFVLLLLYGFAALGFMFWHFLSTVAVPFHALGLDWLFYTVAGLAAFSLMLVGSVFFAKAQLYEARDNQLLLSMPIRPGDVLMSRMLTLLVICVAFSLPVTVPTAIIGLMYMEPTALEIVSFVLLFLLLPLLSLALSALLGWLFSVLSARVKRKALFGTLLCVIFIVLYSLFMARLNTSIMFVGEHAEELAQTLGAFLPVYWFGVALGQGSVAYTLILVVIFIGVAALVYALLSATFIRTATANRGFAKVKYVERRTAAASPDAALFRRELARFGSSSAYIMNSAMGAILLLLGAALLLIKRDAASALAASDPQLQAVLPPILIAGLCLFAVMDLVSAPSVSMEGVNLWIVRSLPVSSAQALRAKLRVHLAICVPPMLIAAAVLLVVFDMSALYAALLLTLPSAMTLFTGLLGLAENLLHPNLDWTNEAQAVKTGFGLLLTMLIGFAAVALPVGAVLLLGGRIPTPLVALVYLALLLAASLLLWRWLMSKGASLFDEL